VEIMLAKAALVALVMLMVAVVPAGAQTTGQATGDPARRAAELASQAVATQVNGQAIDELVRHAAELAASAQVAQAGRMAGDLARQLIDEQGALLRSSTGELAFAQVLADQARVQATPFIVVERGEQGQYERGQNALDNGKWDQAIEAFDQVIQKKGAKAEGATYWKAYAQNRLGRRTDALATLDALLKAYPNGRWANDAKALQVEVKQAAGQVVRPEQEVDEDLKLIALNSLLQTDADKAVPMLETFLKGSSSPKLKERALFVLAQVDSPQARAALTAVAKGQANPDLQLRAVRYLGMHRGDENVKLLVEIYKSTSDTDVKRQVIQSLTMAGSFGRYALRVRREGGPVIVGQGTGAGRTTGVGEADKATQEYRSQEEKLRKEAFNAQNELWQLYQSEASAELREQMLQALAMNQGYDKLLEVARTEKNEDLRRAAVQSLGMAGADKTGEALLSLYKGEKDPELRKAAIQGLFMQQNAAALVQIARQETDPQLKKDVVQKLSMMKSKEATDYMLELLKK
jgi:HEAT repeat protein